MTHEKAIPLFALVVLATLALPGRASAATTTMTLQTGWDEASCTGTIYGNPGVTRYAVAEGDTVVVTLENIAGVPLDVLYSLPNGSSATKTVVAGGNDVQTLANFKDTFQISPAPSSTACGVSNKAYALLYAEPPPYTGVAALPPYVATRQTATGTNTPLSQSKTVEAANDTSEAIASDPAPQIYGDPQISETHGRAAKTIVGMAGPSWPLFVPPLLLLVSMGVICVLRWRSLAAVFAYNRPKKRAKKRR